MAPSLFTTSALACRYIYYVCTLLDREGVHGAGWASDGETPTPGHIQGGAGEGRGSRRTWIRSSVTSGWRLSLIPCKVADRSLLAGKIAGKRNIREGVAFMETRLFNPCRIGVPLCG
jgi:hypothetical protein